MIRGGCSQRAGSRARACRVERCCALTRQTPRRYTRRVIRKQRVTRVVYAVFILFVAAFVISSIAQVARKVFGEPETLAGAADARLPKVSSSRCAAALAQEIAAIDNARAIASTEENKDAAKARFSRERREKTTADAPGACAEDPHGTEALASLARFDRAAEAHALREASELSPVRLAAQSFISGHPR